MQFKAANYQIRKNKQSITMYTEKGWEGSPIQPKDVILPGLHCSNLPRLSKTKASQHHQLFK